MDHTRAARFLKYVRDREIVGARDVEVLGLTEGPQVGSRGDIAGLFKPRSKYHVPDHDADNVPGGMRGDDLDG